MINGMTLRFLSNQNNIQYDVQGEDVFLWKGEKGKAKEVRNRKSKLKVNSKNCKKNIMSFKRQLLSYNKIINRNVK